MMSATFDSSNSNSPSSSMNFLFDVLDETQANCRSLTSAANNNDQPTEFDIVCGRGKGNYNRLANKRFLFIVRNHMEEYESKTNRLDKAIVLNYIIEEVQAQTNASGHIPRFMKQNKNGFWLELPLEKVREKIGHVIRESISAEKGEWKREQVRKEFATKHDVLLSQQKSIFKSMLLQQSSQRTRKSKFSQARKNQ